MTNKKINNIKDLHRSLPDPKYVEINPKHGLAGIKQPNFITKKRKAKEDGHEILHIHYTEK